MTPRFDIFRKLYARILAKPEALVVLGKWRGDPVDCGTPACVLGELVSMPEAVELGFGWRKLCGNYEPTYEGDYDGFNTGQNALGLTYKEGVWLFCCRVNEEIPEKQEALERIEALFAAHGEPLMPLDTEILKDLTRTEVESDECYDPATLEPLRLCKTAVTA